MERLRFAYHFSTHRRRRRQDDLGMSILRQLNDSIDIDLMLGEQTSLLDLVVCPARGPSGQKFPSLMVRALTGSINLIHDELLRRQHPVRSVCVWTGI